MEYVIVNDDGHLYGGFDSEKSKPVWFKNMRDECRMEEPIADSVLRQLVQLGFTGMAKREAHTIAKKWVPKSVDASTLPEAL